MEENDMHLMLLKNIQDSINHLDERVSANLKSSNDTMAANLKALEERIDSINTNFTSCQLMCRTDIATIKTEAVTAAAVNARWTSAVVAFVSIILGYLSRTFLIKL